MTSERALWEVVRRDLSPWGMLHRVENIGAGTFDVAYALRFRGEVASGWLELKEVDGWPVRASTPFRIPTLTIDQARFGQEWAAAGGRAFGLIQVGRRGYWLVTAATLADIYDRRLTADAVRAVAVAGSGTRFPFGDVLRALTQ